MDRSCSAPHPPLIRQAAPQGKLEIMGKTEFSWPELEDVHHVWTHPEVDLSNQDWWGHKLHNYWCVELKPCLVVSFKRFQTDWLHQRWREYSITSELLSSPNSALQHMPASIFRKEIPEQFASNLLLKKVLENPAMKISPPFSTWRSYSKSLRFSRSCARIRGMQHTWALFWAWRRRYQSTWICQELCYFSWYHDGSYLIMMDLVLTTHHMRFPFAPACEQFIASSPEDPRPACLPAACLIEVPKLICVVVYSLYMSKNTS